MQDVSFCKTTIDTHTHTHTHIYIYIYIAYFSMLKLVDYILVYGARRLLMLDGDSLIPLDVMMVDFTTCFILSR